MKAIIAKNVTKQFEGAGSGPLYVLKDINLEVDTGETIAIVGASGSGKTTLLSLLAGLDTSDSGTICINGTDITHLTEKERSILRAQSLGFVFQDFMLLPHMTVLENVMLSLEIRNEKNARERALADLEKVGMAEKIHSYPNQLSGGEQQRTALIRAFVTRPKLLFADEPSGNLDDATGSLVTKLLFDLNHANNTTLILVTHDMRLANMCQTVYLLSAGSLQRKQKPNDK